MKRPSKPKPILSHDDTEFIIGLAEEMAYEAGYLRQGYSARVQRVAALLRSARRELARRRKSTPRQATAHDRLPLWAHLVSEHAACVGLDLTAKDLAEFHRHEHKGPGTIREHSPRSRAATMAKIIYVMSEADTGIMSMEDCHFRLHCKLVCDEARRRGINLEETSKE